MEVVAREAAVEGFGSESEVPNSSPRLVGGFLTRGQGSGGEKAKTSPRLCKGGTVRPS